MMAKAAKIDSSDGGLSRRAVAIRNASHRVRAELDQAEKPMAERVGRGSLTGRWEPRPGACPNIRGGITVERDVPANTRL